LRHNFSLFFSDIIYYIKTVHNIDIKKTESWFRLPRFDFFSFF
jgi:hypothetical protein